LVNDGGQVTSEGEDYMEGGEAPGMDEDFDELSLDTIKEIDPIQEQSRNNTHKNLQQYPYQIVQ
jgi:hypothetical protein